MLDSFASILTPARPMPASSTSTLSHAIPPLSLRAGLKQQSAAGSEQWCAVELPSALSLSIATTRCPSTASSLSCSPRDGCQSAYADLFSPPSAVGPLSPFALPLSACTASTFGKRTTSSVCRALHFRDDWLTQAASARELLVQPPLTAVHAKAGAKRHNRRDKSKRRSRSAQRHPHSAQQHIDDTRDSAALPATHTPHGPARSGGGPTWEQLFASESPSSDDEWEGGEARRSGGKQERVDISRAFVFSDLY